MGSERGGAAIFLLLATWSKHGQMLYWRLWTARPPLLLDALHFLLLTTITVSRLGEVAPRSPSLDWSTLLCSPAFVYVLAWRPRRCCWLLGPPRYISLILSVVVIVLGVIAFVSCSRSREADCRDNLKEAREKVVLSHLNVGLFIQIDIYKVTRRHFHMELHKTWWHNLIHGIWQGH